MRTLELSSKLHRGSLGWWAVALLAGLTAGCGAQPGDEPAVPPGAGAKSSLRCSGKQGAPHDSTITITSGGKERTTYLHVPRGYDPTKGASLALAYHFVGGVPVLMAVSTMLNVAADARGFLIAYPAGIGQSFNAGKCCGKAWEQGIDDIGFTRDLVATIERDYCVDPARVFATGMSNGALMAERVGCELGDQFAAIAPVAGVLDLAPIAGTTELGPICKKSRPVSIFEVHGTADPSMPYEGGAGKSPVPVAGDLDFISVARNIELWRGEDGCSATSSTTYSKGDASCVGWSECAKGAMVELCTIQGGGHTWPGGYIPIEFGKTSLDLDASGAILDFFEAHRRD